MYTVNLRKVGGSVMLAVPPALLDVLGVSAGKAVDLSLENGRVMITPKKEINYSLDELLAQCDLNTELTEEDREWLDAELVGSEFI